MARAHVGKGDVVMVDVPYLDGARSVRRPALVICDTTQMLDVVIAAISSRVRKPLPRVHYLIDRSHPDWPASGLRLDSVVRCDRIFTADHSQIHRTIGSLTNATLSDVDLVLKKAFALK